MSTKNKKNIKLFLKVAFTAIFLWWIIFKVDWQEALFYLKKIKTHHILLYLALYFLGMIASSYKWQFLALTKGIKLPLKKFFEYYFSATFINNFMPSFVGGDAFKAYKVGQISKKYKEAISSVVFDRITGLWGAMVLALAFSALNWTEVSKSEALPLITLSIVAALVASYLLVRYPGLFNVFPQRIKKFFKRAMQEIVGYNEASNVTTKSILLSFVFNFIGLAGANYVLFSALGIEIGFFDYLSVIFLISIVSSVPITVGNIGVKEWAYITFFGIFGASAAAVITVAILSRILQMTSSFFAWPLYLRNNKESLKKKVE